MRKIDSIILHCSATEAGKDFHASDIDRWHRQKGWRCIGYHYVIDLDGTIEPGRKVSDVGAHCKGHNAHSIGICYIGGLRPSPLGVSVPRETGEPKGVKRLLNGLGEGVDTRTPAQRESLMVLVRKLMTMYNLSPEQVHCHYEFAHKACPCFTIESFRDELLRTR